MKYLVTRTYQYTTDEIVEAVSSTEARPCNPTDREERNDDETRIQVVVTKIGIKPVTLRSPESGDWSEGLITTPSKPSDVEIKLDQVGKIAQLEAELCDVKKQRDDWANECEANLKLLKEVTELCDAAIQQRDRAGPF